MRVDLLNLLVNFLDGRLQILVQRARDSFITVSKQVELFFGETLHVNQLVVSALDRVNQFIELEMERLRLAILRVLDQENHQEGDDRRTSVDDKLPGFGVLKIGSSRGPGDDRQERSQRGPTVSGRVSGPGRDRAEQVPPAGRRSVPVRFVTVLRVVLSP
jgi:hypothetical protein